jgi:hypothetical protein
MKRYVIGFALCLTACASAPTPMPLTATQAPTLTPAPTLEPTATSDPNKRVDEKGVAQVWVPAGSFMMGAIESEQIDPPSFAIVEKRANIPCAQFKLPKAFGLTLTK